MHAHMHTVPLCCAPADSNLAPDNFRERLMLRSLGALVDTVPTHWRLRRVVAGAGGRSRAGMRFIDLGACVVRVRQAGERGPSLVLATDPPVPIEAYDELIATLADRYRVSVFELPGFGCSMPRSGYRFSLPQAVAAVAALLDRLSAGPHVLGLPCVAGFVAIALARHHPRLVDRLLLMQTPTWDGAQHWLAQRDPQTLLRTPIVGQVALAAMRRRRIRQWYASALGDPARIAQLTALTLANFDDGGCFCLASGFQDFLRDHHGLLGPVTQETLILWGRADLSHARTDHAATSRLAPNSRRVDLDTAGHFPELEAPQRFATELDLFLRPERSQ